MVQRVRSPYASAQMAVWLRGLLTIALADGQCDENEQRLIATLMDEQDLHCEPISAAELAAGLGDDPTVGENFLRTAVMVAIADGAYSHSEALKIQEFSAALNLAPPLLNSLNAAIEPVSNLIIETEQPAFAVNSPDLHHSLLHPLQDWLDQVDVQDARLAHFLCRMIPAQCPFERDVNLFGRKIAHIPALCKLNPVYEQLVGLRFRALSYLADECKEDVTRYC
ncbi:nitrogenase [Microcoleus sp. FACHB-1515]|uniref:Mo-dependent nitrogenase C-terminal domain-containing protein n=1 Tax=Cyanophyceae TaxID=3028117 RepID=UPI00168612C3|nr:Mo-dependent nitrogenase C-terminal domain-containing protein [Microcoleus sp. FACHB-1515]MBD2088800.1 nitrogenase [Microcoleus sp. FACHB-1515]